VKLVRRKEKLTWPDWWGQSVSVGREEAEIPFQVCTLLGLGAILWLGRIGPRGLLFFFDFLLVFFFLFSVFISIFCKNASNHFKLLS
jgi:hypothetical protein